MVQTQGLEGATRKPGYYQAMTPLKSGLPMDGDPATFMTEEEGATRREDV